MKDDGPTQAPPGIAEPLWFTVVRTEENAAPGQTTAIRLIGLLPSDWACESAVANDEIRLGIPQGQVPPAGLRARLESVLQDSALSGWHLR